MHGHRIIKSSRSSVRPDQYERLIKKDIRAIEILYYTVPHNFKGIRSTRTVENFQFTRKPIIYNCTWLFRLFRTNSITSLLFESRVVWHRIKNKVRRPCN